MRMSRASRAVGLWVLIAVSPLLMGGCPDFRAEITAAFEAAAQNIAAAALSDFFDQFR